MVKHAHIVICTAETYSGRHKLYFFSHQGDRSHFLLPTPIFYKIIFVLIWQTIAAV